MAGYRGYSMSNNAVSAYDDGEKPISKWTKVEILDAISKIRGDLDFSKLTVAELKRKFLYNSSWHHTSKYYNVTEFYSIDEDEVKECTQDDIEEIISSRPKKVKRDKAVIEVEKQAKEINRVLREYKKIAKLTSQNEYYVDKIFVKEIKYKDLHIVKDRIKLLEDLMEKFKLDKETKYKSLRGYINNYLKSQKND